MADSKPLKIAGVDVIYTQGLGPKEMNMPEPNINTLLFFEDAPALEVIVDAFEKHVWPSRKFSSVASPDGYWQPRLAQMDLAYHFREIQVANRAEIDAFASKSMRENLDHSYPLWQVIILRARTGPSAVYLRLGHVLGDGLAILYAALPMMSCDKGDVLSHIPLPPALLPPSKTAAAAVKSTSGGGGCCSGIFDCLRGAFGIFVSKPDTELFCNRKLVDRKPFVKYNGRREFTRLPAVPLSELKSIAKKRGCSINDVLMAALAGAFRQYGAECGDEKLKNTDNKVECNTFMMVALPRPVDLANPWKSLTNNIIFASLPFPIGESTPEARLSAVTKACGNLKSKPYMTGMISLMKCMTGIAPKHVLDNVAAESFSNHSLLVTNVPGPAVPVTWPSPKGGKVIQEIRIAVLNTMTQVSIITYNGTVFPSIVADPDLLPDPEQFGKYWMSELKDLLAF